MARKISRARVAAGFLGVFVAIALAGAPPARSYSDYAGQIPNIPAAGGCGALCHSSGGSSSQLYIDFEAAGFIWNAQMASADSDDDGFSNGWELQDPPGTWVAGGAEPGSPALVANPTLPGDLPPLPVATVPTAITHTEAAGTNGSEAFAIQNIGAVPFDYSVTPSDVWMAPDPLSGSALPASEQDELLLLFTTNGLLEGLYQGDLTINIPGIRADQSLVVNVDLTVPEPSAIFAGGCALLSLGLLARRRA